MSKIAVKIEKEISWQTIADTLVSAFEGGSNYWYQIEMFKKPSNFNNSEKGDEQFRHMSYPINENGGLLVSNRNVDDTYKAKWVNQTSIKNGVKIMQQYHPSHFQDMIEKNGDATTGDVFLQCILFGEVIYR